MTDNKTIMTESRTRANNLKVQFLEKFRKTNGSYICNEILGCGITTSKNIGLHGRSSIPSMQAFCMFQLRQTSRHLSSDQQYYDWNYQEICPFFSRSVRDA